MHLLSDVMKNRNYTEVKQETQNRLESWNVINLLVAAED